MSSDKNNGKSGFAGLDSMVSDVDTPAAAPSQANSLSLPSPEPAKEELAPPQPAYAPPDSSGSRPGGSGKWWLIGIGVFLFFIWVSDSSKNTSGGTSSAPSYSSSVPTPAAAPTPKAPPVARSSVPERAPAVPSNDEEMPPVGSGLSLSRAQIRYCLSEDIRISAWQEQVDHYSESSVSAFNMAANNYNMRCSSFRYRRGMLESVRAEVEANRHALQLEGIRSAMLNP